MRWAGRDGNREHRLHPHRPFGVQGELPTQLPCAFPLRLLDATGCALGGLNSCQAASRNIPMPTIWLAYIAAGPHTRMYFYEAAAYLLCAVTSGAPSVQTPHPAKAVKIDGITPLEARFGVETAIAAAKLTRSRASELVLRLLEQYESQIANPPSGSTYQECYDVTTGKPGQAYLRLYEEVQEELAGMGIPFA